MKFVGTKSVQIPEGKVVIGYNTLVFIYHNTKDNSHSSDEGSCARTSGQCCQGNQFELGDS